MLFRSLILYCVEFKLKKNLCGIIKFILRINDPWNNEITTTIKSKAAMKINPSKFYHEEHDASKGL